MRRLQFSIQCMGACLVVAWAAGATAAEAVAATNSAAPVPRYFAASPGSLVKARERLAAGDESLRPALAELRREAESALLASPPTVMEKQSVPPSGDKHDYMSLAPYFWPDPKTKDGRPYIRKDGRVNPESRDPKLNDSAPLGRFAETVETLALAYWFTGDERYAQHAARCARAWFLDPATRMNPHFKYAQAVRGVNEGRAVGLIEARSIAEAADALGLLAGSPAWPAADQQAVAAWLNTFLNWLLESAPGREERAAENNHGNWYDVQVVQLALCLGRTELARQILADARQRRIAPQISPDGRQPLELARTMSLNYSRFNLRAFTVLADFGTHAGVDLWNYETPDGRGLRRAFAFLLPYVDRPPKPWPFPQLRHADDEAFGGVLRRAAIGCNAPEFEAVARKYPGLARDRSLLLFVR